VFKQLIINGRNQNVFGTFVNPNSRILPGNEKRRKYNVLCWILAYIQMVRWFIKMRHPGGQPEWLNEKTK
jgi:hypothetical protein